MKTLLALGFLSGLTASAGVIYHFDFTSLNNGRADFRLDIVFPDYIRTTGMAPLGDSLPTTLGYNVNNFGENNSGWFGFSESGGVIDDNSFTYSVTSFLFQPFAQISGYVKAPAVYQGSITGNAPFSFSGIGRLTVTEIPEPSTWTLAVFALAVQGIRRRISWNDDLN